MPIFDPLPNYYPLVEIRSTQSWIRSNHQFHLDQRSFSISHLIFLYCEGCGARQIHITVTCYTPATVLAALPGTAVYLDDIVVHGKDMGTHDESLRQMFTALSRQNLTLIRKMCVCCPSNRL